MNLDLTTPALLFPAVAILMLGYINRYVGAAQVIRTFKKDYDAGYKHVDVALQLKIMRRRISLFQLMIGTASISLLLACASMLFIYEHWQVAGEVTFAIALFCLILSITFALFETSLSNRSLDIEIDDILQKEKAKKD